MKATLEFNLPEEREEFNTAVNAGGYRAVIEDLENYLRQKTKYEELSEKENAIYDGFKNIIRSFREDRGV